MRTPMIKNRYATRDGKALVGCLVALGVVLVLLGIGVVVVLMNWRSWMAEGIKVATTEAIRQADIPEGEKPEMIAHVEDYTAAFEAGDVTFEQFGLLMQELEQSSLIPVGIIYSVEQGYVEPSGLTDEEKAAGKIALHRFARGLHEKSIPVEAMQEAAAPIGYEDANGQFRLNPKESVSDDMLREVIANAKAKADEASVPEEDFVVDLSDEMERVLNASRGRTGP
jgi:hypothetical protein